MATSFSAPGKLIFCGEHAVVYGRPAIALPLGGVRASAQAEALPPGAGLLIEASDLGRRWAVAAAPDDPLSHLSRRVLAAVGAAPPDALIRLSSAIPIASGMGSGAAIATALARALAGLVGASLAPAEVSALVYESERYYHGTPSGIDNTVVAYEQPIWYLRGTPPTIELLSVAAPLTLVVGDTGVRSETRLPVGEVRRRWQADPARYEALFDRVAALVAAARGALAAGDSRALGALLDANQELLAEIGVSSPELERLIAAARAAGALGAKLSGGGWGGVMLALVSPESQGEVAAALSAAGATRVISSTLTLTLPAPFDTM